jgi:hypothetical protein
MALLLLASENDMQENQALHQNREYPKVIIMNVLINLLIEFHPFIIPQSEPVKSRLTLHISFMDFPALDIDSRNLWTMNPRFRQHHLERFTNSVPNAYNSVSVSIHLQNQLCQQSTRHQESWTRQAVICVVDIRDTFTNWISGMTASVAMNALATSAYVHARLKLGLVVVGERYVGNVALKRAKGVSCFARNVWKFRQCWLTKCLWILLD